MYQQKVLIDEDTIERLSQKLKIQIINSKISFQGKGSSGNVVRVHLIDQDQQQWNLILKPQEKNFIQFYKELLVKYSLNYPVILGSIIVKQKTYSIQQFIPHHESQWTNSDTYYQVLDWLIKKDQICIENLSNIKDLKYLEITKFYGIETWFKQIQKAALKSNRINKAIWEKLSNKRIKIQNALKIIETNTPLTIVHGDLQMNNVLFGKDEFQNQLFVIDWTQPRIGSVCVDLAQLVDHAPIGIKDVLIDRYQNNIPIKDFQSKFRAAQLIRNLSYLAWMALMINEGEGSNVMHIEVNRVSQQLIEGLP